MLDRCNYCKQCFHEARECTLQEQNKEEDSKTNSTLHRCDFCHSKAHHEGSCLRKESLPLPPSTTIPDRQPPSHPKDIPHLERMIEDTTFCLLDTTTVPPQEFHCVGTLVTPTMWSPPDRDSYLNKEPSLKKKYPPRRMGL